VTIAAHLLALATGFLIAIAMMESLGL